MIPNLLFIRSRCFSPLSEKYSSHIRFTSSNIMRIWSKDPKSPRHKITLFLASQWKVQFTHKIHLLKYFKYFSLYITSPGLRIDGCSLLLLLLLLSSRCSVPKGKTWFGQPRCPLNWLHKPPNKILSTYTRPCTMNPVNCGLSSSYFHQSDLRLGYIRWKILQFWFWIYLVIWLHSAGKNRQYHLKI